MDRERLRVERMWVIKVRIHLGYGYDIWKEYKVEVENQNYGDPSFELLGRSDELVDVFLSESHLVTLLRSHKALDATLLHLDSEQISALTSASPALLFERRTLEQARTIQTQLEAHNFHVVLEPSYEY